MARSAASTALRSTSGVNKTGEGLGWIPVRQQEDVITAPDDFGDGLQCRAARTGFVIKTKDIVHAVSCHDLGLPCKIGHDRDHKIGRTGDRLEFEVDDVLRQMQRTMLAGHAEKAFRRHIDFPQLQIETLLDRRRSGGSSTSALEKINRGEIATSFSANHRSAFGGPTTTVGLNAASASAADARPSLRSTKRSFRSFRLIRSIIEARRTRKYDGDTVRPQQ